MAINFTTFWTRFGKFAHSGNTIQTALQTTIEDEVEDAIQAVGGTNTIEFEQMRQGILDGLRSLQSSGTSAQVTTFQTPMVQLLIDTIKADNPQPSTGLTDALDELILQMTANSESLDASTPGCTPSYGGANTGNGVVVISTKRGDGKVNEHILAEDLEGEVTNAPTSGIASISFAGEPSVGTLAYNWPGGSGSSLTLTSHTSDSSDSLVTNGGFETQDTNATHVPDGWIVSVGTLGTTVKLGSVEVQTVIISGTPTGGFYVLHWANAASKTQTTVPLAYNASQAAVQSALRALVGLESVTVATSGTSPNFTHTITFTGVPGPAQLTSTDSMTGGTPNIAHATSTAGSANVMRGARSIEIDSDGAELTALNVPVTVEKTTQYCVNMWLKTDSAPAAGVITVDLVDGIGGSVIADDAGTSNSFTIDATALTTSFVASNGVFRLPTVLPPIVLLRIRVSTAISNTSSVFIDEVVMVQMDQFYTGGLYASAFTGPTLWEVGDTVKLPVTNDRAGALHEWANRIYGLREQDLLIPTDTGGSETQADSLIA